MGNSSRLLKWVWVWRLIIWSCILPTNVHMLYEWVVCIVSGCVGVFYVQGVCLCMNIVCVCVCVCVCIIMVMWLCSENEAEVHDITWHHLTSHDLHVLNRFPSNPSLPTSPSYHTWGTVARCGRSWRRRGRGCGRWARSLVKNGGSSQTMRNRLVHTYMYMCGLLTCVGPYLHTILTVDLCRTFIWPSLDLFIVLLGTHRHCVNAFPIVIMLLLSSYMYSIKGYWLKY